MRLCAAVLTMMIITSGSSYAERWSKSLETTVLVADVIVVGTMKAVARSFHDVTAGDITIGTRVDGTGLILVDDVLWGAVAVGSTLGVSWSRRDPRICPHGPPIDAPAREGNLGIWLLRQGDDGMLPATASKWFLHPDSLDVVKEILSMAPVVLRVARVSKPVTERSSVNGGSPSCFSIHFRNASTQEARFPGVMVTEDAILLDPRWSFEFVRMDRGDSGIQAVPVEISSRVIEEPVEVTVPGGTEHVVYLDPTQLTDIRDYCYCCVSCRLEGYRPSNTLFFLVGRAGRE